MSAALRIARKYLVGGAVAHWHVSDNSQSRGKLASFVDAPRLIINYWLIITSRNEQSSASY